MLCWCVCFFKQKTAYDMRISDWSSDVCSSDLDVPKGKRNQQPAADMDAELDPAAPRALQIETMRAECAEEEPEQISKAHRSAACFVDPDARDRKSVV